LIETFVTAKKQDIKSPAPRGKSQTTATSAAILGRPVSKAGEMTDSSKKVKPEWQKYYQHLVELRDQLRRQMDGLAQESAQELAGYSLHMADSGTDNFDRDFALSLLSSDQDAIYEIEEALKRIEKKTYGICELTAKPIPKARLEAIPWTRFTVEAQAQLEKDGALRSRRLGQLGTIETAGVGEVESEEGEEQLEEGSNKAKEKE
jgi:DnaK suppressor protein